MGAARVVGVCPAAVRSGRSVRRWSVWWSAGAARRGMPPGRPPDGLRAGGAVRVVPGSPAASRGTRGCARRVAPVPVSRVE
ncbi:hypothetical protein SSBG_04991 [Streptomyces sp. SPB074]|nr:hypothetical protein SSBG_04991 [Streptomyces sp. SPB074]